MEEKGSDYIRINNLQLRPNGRFSICSKIEMFKSEYIVCKVHDEYLTFSVPTIDYRGKSNKPSDFGGDSIGWRKITVSDDRLITGKFEIDEDESTEDILVFYYD